MSLERKISFLQKIRNFLTRRTVGWGLALSLAALPPAYSCTTPEETPPEITPADVPAGTVGKCVETEIFPGYTSCIMDEAQEFPSGTGQTQSPLGEDLPARVNHRDYIDANCPPVHNQGNCGWCVAHATTAAMEALECRVTGSERISEPHLWFLGRGDIDNCKGGWYTESAMVTAQNNKLVAHSLWPYSTLEGELSRTKPANETLTAEGRYSIDEYVSLSAGDIESIKIALASGFNVVYGVPVFCDTGWFKRNTEGEIDENVGNIVAPPSTAGSPKCVDSGQKFENCKVSGRPFCLSGHHAILLVGYDNDAQQFILRNSWSTGWADEGYANLSFEYLEKFGRGGAYPAYTSCTPHKAKTCHEGDVYWVNSCGNLGEVFRACGSSEVCQEGECLPLERIIFTSRRGYGGSEIYVMNADGSNQRNLTNNRGHNWSPSWSPDGQQIAFTVDDDGWAEIYVMDTNGSNQRRLTNNSNMDISPSWSPNGSQIAFTSYRYSDFDICVMNADGTNQRNLTNNSADDKDPAWSPDGTKIAFRSSRDGNYEIYVMNTDGTNPRRLTNNPAYDGRPDWSPDGTQIAFDSYRDGNREIYVMNADGTNPRNLTNNSANDYYPAWSPDGTRIAFQSYRDGNYEIYLMNADGSNQRNITNNPDDDKEPDWAP